MKYIYQTIESPVYTEEDNKQKQSTNRISLHKVSSKGELGTQVGPRRETEILDKRPGGTES